MRCDVDPVLFPVATYPVAASVGPSTRTSLAATLGTGGFRSCQDCDNHASRENLTLHCFLPFLNCFLGDDLCRGIILILKSVAPMRIVFMESTAFTKAAKLETGFANGTGSVVSLFVMRNETGEVASTGLD
jgi:hypothetical protein